MGRDRWSNRSLVEDCRVLDIGPIIRAGALRAPWGTFCNVTWTRPDGMITSAVGFTVTEVEGEKRVRLAYSVGVGDGESENVSYDVSLTTTPCYLGGVRYWFLCPVIAPSKCERRVAKLYLPPGAKYFACRKCHDLTYRSSREHNPRWDWLRGLPPEQLDRLLVEKLSDLDRLIREGS